MYSNFATNFIMGFVSPIPSFSNDNDGKGAPISDHSGIAVDSLADHEHTPYFSPTCEFLLEHLNSNSTNHSSWESGHHPSEWTFGKTLNVSGESGSSNPNLNYHHQHHHPQGSNYPGLSSSSVSNYDGGGPFCPIDWDNILCWPQTAAGEIATLPCFDKFQGVNYNSSGFATRLCMEDGIWNKSQYSGCIPFNPNPNITTDTGNLDITTGIYLFGYCLSLLALIVAAVIFISFKELRCLRNTIHSHLLVTYVLADALWVLSVVSTDQERNVRHTTQATCFTFMLLHYFHLTNFFWMFVEGLYLYVLVVQTFMTECIRLRTYCVIGWGVPLLVVLVWSVTKWATMNIQTGGAMGKFMQMAEVAEFSNAVVCPWLHANQYDWIYNASALLVLAANLVFLLQIMWVLITKLRSATSQETQQSRKAAKALVVLMPLLGITYVLVLIGPKKWPAFEHTRAFFLSTQGFLVALLYCFLNAEVRMAIRHRWNRMENVGSGLKCCCCCNSSTQQNLQNLRDWSPRSRTESIRLYTPTSQNYRKRESSASETTTMTAVVSSFNGSGHGHAVTTVAGNGSTALITTMTGRRISTAPLQSCRQSTFTEESALV